MILGDRTSVVVSLTVRFRLRPDGLRTVHERFGPRGIFGNVRDQCQRAVVATLGPRASASTTCSARLARRAGKPAEQIGDVLNADGIELISVLLGVVDLGRVGEVIQDTMRARYEVEREAAEAATRLARAQNDTELQRQMAPPTICAALPRNRPVARAGAAHRRFAGRAPGTHQPAGRRRHRPGPSADEYRCTPPGPVVTDAESTPGYRLLEILAVLLLGITTIGTAWCGYQASQWNGVQGDLSRESSDERVEGGRLFGLASQRIAYDASTVAQYAVAAAAGDERLLQFYRDTLVRPDFRPLLDRWEQEVRSGGTPTSLFQDTVYLDQQFGEYRAATERAERATVASQEAGATADAYVVTTILLTVGLFFAGITSSFRWRPARVLLLIGALGTIAVAAARLAELPVA